MANEKNCLECGKGLVFQYPELKNGEKYCIRCYSALIRKVLPKEIVEKPGTIFDIQDKLPEGLQLTNKSKEYLQEHYQNMQGVS